MPHLDALELINRVTSFAESALTVEGHPTSGNARLLVSDAKHHLSLEVTHRDDRAYDVVINDRSVMRALDDLRQWATRPGSTFLVERGPRDELRIDIVII